MVEAKRLISKIGRPLIANLVTIKPILADNQYLHTPWRQSPSWGDGGFFYRCICS
jgi:hypothetical protein